MSSAHFPIRSRLLYAGLWCFALPTLCAYLFWRAIKSSAYRENFMQRVACYRTTLTQSIWVHAASLGEVKAAELLIQQLRRDYAHHPLLITCQTPAGIKAAEQLKLENCTAVYLPFDLSWLMQRFIQHFKPRMAIVLETEIWPNMIRQLKQNHVPVVLVNARMSARSLQRYQRFALLFRPAIANFDAIACQSEADFAHYALAGARLEALSMTGNMKWDAANALLTSVQSEVHSFPASTRPIWLAASTHAEEETAVLNAHLSLRASSPNALLIWAPRHTERFEVVCELLSRSGINYGRRSVQGSPNSENQVFVLDTLGELLQFMPSTQAVFVGGSLQNIGGHNVLEPAACGVPILVGPYTQHFQDSVAILQQAGGLMCLEDAEHLKQTLLQLMVNPSLCAQMGDANKACVRAQGGALEKTKALIAQRLVG